MKKSIILIAVAVLTIAGSVMAGDVVKSVNTGKQDSQNVLLDNAYLSIGAGIDSDYLAGKTSLFEAAGLSLGLPVTKLKNGAVVGAQVSMGATAIEFDPSRDRQISSVQDNDSHRGIYDVTLGLFVRNLKLGSNQAALGLMCDYVYTAKSNNLLGVRPIAGVTLTDKDEVGITGRAGVVAGGGEEIVDEINLFWTHVWNKNIVTSSKCGYLFGDIRELISGTSIEYRITKHVSAIASTLMDGDGNYNAGITLVIGGKGQVGPDLEQIRGNGLNPFHK